VRKGKEVRGRSFGRRGDREKQAVPSQGVLTRGARASCSAESGSTHVRSEGEWRLWELGSPVDVSL